MGCKKQSMTFIKTLAIIRIIIMITFVVQKPIVKA